MDSIETVVYVDSSIIVAQLLRERGRHKAAFAGNFITSELTELECRRTLDRLRLQRKLNDEDLAELILELTQFLAAIQMVSLTADIFKRAKSSFPTVVKSLDSLHLATAELANAKKFWTYDRQQFTAARALGLDPISE